jgi:hypothetical protein
LRIKNKASGPETARLFIRTYSVTPSRKSYSNTCNIKVAQRILRHSHLSTTADLYLRVDQHAMATALAAAKSSAKRATMQRSWPSAQAAQYVFDYDDETISELERAIAQASDIAPGGDSCGSAGVCTHIMPRKSR